MKIRLLFALALAMFAVPLGAAQLYRWVDEQGNVEWRDTPPPANARKVEQRSLAVNTIETSTLPYSVQQAVRNFPVTLWVFDCGEPCTRARAHLSRRGVPHTERNALNDADELKKLAGGTQVPVLLVGSRQLKGYLDSDWDSALDAAGYPRAAIPGMKQSGMKDAAQVAQPPAQTATKSGAPATPR